MTPAEIVAGLRALLPPGAVLDSPAQRLAYECDGYTIEKAAPAVVLLPGSTEEVVAVVRFARDHGLSISPRGAGTGLSGGCLAAEGGLMLALSRMNRILEIDPVNRRALVEAGCVNLHLSEAAARDGLMFAPDPSSQSACTIGGNVAENAGGPHTLKYGVTANHVLGLEVVLPDGTVLWVGGGCEDMPGYDLTGLLVGSEGTLGIVTRALVRLVPRPEGVRTLLAVFGSIDEASAAVSALIGGGIVPAALEMMDATVLKAVEAAFRFGFPEGAGAVLIVELDGLEAGLDAAAERAVAMARAHGASEVRAAASAAERARLWLARKKAVGALGRLAPSKLTMDGVIPRTKLPEVLRAISGVGARHGLRVANVFHAGDGNLHPILLFDQKSPGEVERVLTAGGEILDICLAAGGSISGEHGVGVEKREYMPKMFSEADLVLMGSLRAVFDPDGRFNPGKLLPQARGCGEAASQGLSGAPC